MLSDSDLEGGLLAKQHRRVLFLWTALLLGIFLVPETKAQSSSPTVGTISESKTSLSQATSHTDLQRGIDLTRRGFFKEAIPSLSKVRSEVPEDYAAGFNLALCYLGIGE